MRRNTCFIISLITFTTTIIPCTTITHNHAHPPSFCEFFPLLNSHLPKSHITKRANAEGNQPWWKRLCRTPTYGASLEIEHLLLDLHEAGEHCRTMHAQRQKENHHIDTPREPDLAQFTEENLGSFLQEKIATILGESYRPGIHKKEYDTFMATISALKKHYEQSPDQHHAKTSKKCKRKIIITNESRPLWAYVRQPSDTQKMALSLHDNR